MAHRRVRAGVALIRHRPAGPLTAICGAALTLSARRDLPERERLALVDLIAEQGALLERLALDPITNAGEHELRPRPER